MKRTRQDKILEMFPNAMLRDEDVLEICPQLVNREYICLIYSSPHDSFFSECKSCCKNFWNEEA